MHKSTNIIGFLILFLKCPLDHSKNDWGIVFITVGLWCRRIGPGMCLMRAVFRHHLEIDLLTTSYLKWSKRRCVREYERVQGWEIMTLPEMFLTGWVYQNFLWSQTNTADEIALLLPVVQRHYRTVTVLPVKEVGIVLLYKQSQRRLRLNPSW